MSELNTASDLTLQEAYRKYLPSLIETIISLRKQYIDKAIKSTLDSSEFKREIELLKAEYRGQGKSDEEIEKLVSQRKTLKEKETQNKCEENIKASLGELVNTDELINRFSKDFD